eukprot:4322068-Pleurochrysis_carterae.AAC.1
MPCADHLSADADDRRSVQMTSNTRVGEGRRNACGALKKAKLEAMPIACDLKGETLASRRNRFRVARFHARNLDARDRGRAWVSLAGESAQGRRREGQGAGLVRVEGGLKLEQEASIAAKKLLRGLRTAAGESRT